ncbi:calcium-activated potassium channel subunit alpha-1-like isoform X2 [Paramacrobiotus metropolitanus]|uniref:calcium-activated potassium channel subunit alpha-1-like isoform X2 n=1 Tax=Paramacrobiotus metropolitanus TaxID=2943436 RepID=UPI0024461520|nr:calcium-activated potassium channel subunit alpha-1-like isoform X2 [Paramacrobiotus metropolitanus]
MRIDQYERYTPCRLRPESDLTDRKWHWFLISSLTLPILCGVPTLIWSIIQRHRKTQGERSEITMQRRQAGWQTKLNMAVSQIVSDQTASGQSLKLFGFIVSMGSLCIYLEESTWKCEDTELCADPNHHKWNVWWLVDLNFNTYLLFYFLLRFLATSKKARFLFLTTTTYADYFTIPHSILAMYLKRNWFGLRFLRVVNLGWAIDLAHRKRILKNIAQVQLARLGAVIFVFIISGGGSFLMLECGGDPWMPESEGVNQTIWDYCYFSVVTISTVGYGDLVTKTVLGRIFSTFYIFVCVVYLATLMSSVAHLIPAPQRYPVADRNLNYNHVIVCGHVNYQMAMHFLNDFYDDAKTKGTAKIQVVFLHPEEPNEAFVVLLNSYQESVEYIKGSPLNDADLERARAINACACLVFANLRSSNPEDDDAATVLRVLSIKNFCPFIKVQVSVIKTATLNFLRRYPAINLKKGDVIFCFKNLKNGLIGINCRVPGSATILADLIAARTPQETLSECVPDLYAYGRKMKPFSIPFSSSFWGMSFKEGAATCYRKLKVLLVGVYETFEESGEQTSFLFNPGPSFIINERCWGQVICRTSREAARVSIYCDKCHADVNPERIRKCHCKRWKRKQPVSISQAVEVVPRLSIKGPSDPDHRNSSYSEQPMVQRSVLGTPELTRSAISLSQNKRFFADRRDSYKSLEQTQQPSLPNVPLKSLSEQVLQHVKRSMSLDVSKMELPGTAEHAIQRLNRPQFDSTGMFWWCHPQLISDVLINLEQAACREFSDHILICILASGPSNVAGIHDIILPLRSSVLPYEELKEIVILCDPEIIRPEWNFICTTPKLCLVNGNPAVTAALRACYIDYCAMCVMVSGAGQRVTSDALEDRVLADRDVIVTTLNVKSMEFRDRVHTGGEIDRNGQVFPYETGLQVPIISSLEHEKSVRFLSQDRNYLDFRYTFAHMSGSVVVSTALDSMMTSMFYNPALAMSFTQLIYGGESSEFERAFAEGVGLVGSSVLEDDDLNEAPMLVAPPRSSRRLKVQLKLMSMQSEQFVKLEGLTYADLWSYALVHYDMICIGLYLLERDTETKKVKKSHRGKRYVASNPPGHIRMNGSDFIYVLAPSVVI